MAITPAKAKETVSSCVIRSVGNVLTISLYAGIRINGGVELGEGDGAFVRAPKGETIEIDNIGSGISELLVFDID